MLVALTCARQQTNTSNTHITLLQFTGAVCMQYIFVELSGKSDYISSLQVSFGCAARNLENKLARRGALGLL